MNFNLIAQSNTKKIDSLTIEIEKCDKCSWILYERSKLHLLNNNKMKAMSDLNKALEIELDNESVLI